MKTKRHFLTTLLVCFTAAHHATGDDPPAMPEQPDASFTRASETDWHLDWQGVSGRTYFIQTSVDLVNWEYEPAMTFGDGLWHDVLGSDSPKYFVRLHYVDDTTVTTLQQAKNADYDNDGVSNFDEITTLGTNPFRFSTNGSGIADGLQDWDGDGISNADEIALELDPGTNNTGTSSGAQAVDYGYDDANRLTSTTSPLTTESFVPDAEGNLE